MLPLPFVSIVVTTHKSGEWLNDTFKSIFALEYPTDRLEVVVVDDGSEDSTLERVKQLLESGPLPYQTKGIPHSGVCIASNHGWKLAKGEWILFLDHDDLLHPRKLINTFGPDSGLTPDEMARTAVLFSDWQGWALKNGSWGPHSSVVSPQTRKNALLARLAALTTNEFIHPSSALFRRSWIDKVGGFDEQISHAQDYNIQIKVAAAGGEFRRIATTEPMSFWRQVPGSYSRRARGSMGVSILHSLNIALKHLETTTIPTDMRLTLAHNFYWGGLLALEADWNEFRKAADTIDKLYPGYRPLRTISRWTWLLSWVFGYRFAARVRYVYRRFLGR